MNDIFINGKPAAVQGSATGCGGSIVTGSSGLHATSGSKYPSRTVHRIYNQRKSRIVFREALLEDQRNEFPTVQHRRAPVPRLAS
jgi:hypothetical protein